MRTLFLISIVLPVLLAGIALGQGIKFPLDQAVDDFDYDRACPNLPPDYCGCTGSKALMEGTWRPAADLGLKGWDYVASTDTLTEWSLTAGGDLISSFQNNCATNSGFRGASPPLAVRFGAQTLRMNYLDLGAMAQAIDPTKNAVNGTDANPLFVRVSFTPNSTANSQYQSSCYVQLFSRRDVAPVTYLDSEGVRRMIRICRDNTTGFTADFPSSAIAFGFRGGERGGMHTNTSTCGTDSNYRMYRHMLYDGRRWMMLKADVPYTGAPNVETSTFTITAVLEIRTLSFNLKIYDRNNLLTHNVPNIPRQPTAQGAFQYLAIGSSTMTTTAIYVDNVGVAGDEQFSLPGGVLEYVVPAGAGACCKPDRTCESLTVSECQAIQDAEFKGVDTVCGVGQGRCCAAPRADIDHDGDVDMTDFAELQRCLTFAAPGPTLVESCACFDTNDDGVIDETDVIKFLECAGGADIPADAGCDHPPAS